MILDDEHHVSQLDGPDWHTRLSQLCYAYADVRPSWAGAYYPATADEQLEALCGWAQIHYLFYQTLLEDYIKAPGVILDLGCGSGNTTQLLARYNESVVGLDMDPAAIHFAVQYNNRSNITYIQGTFPPPSILLSDFTHVVCVEVFEHIPYAEQWAFLDACLATLRPGGSVLLTTPNETVAAPPHIGIMTPARLALFEATYRGHYQLDYLQTTPPGPVAHRYNPRRGSFPSSHYRIVLRP